MKNQIIAAIISFVMALTATVGFIPDTQPKDSNDTQTQQNEKPSKSARYFLDNDDN